MRAEFWRGKRVFVTGHTGFKGSWLTYWLHHLGAEVTGFALPPEPESLFLRIGLADHIQHLTGDICDPDSFRTALIQARPEMVFHLAAQAHVGQARRDPVRTYLVNLMGTVHLLEALRQVPTLRAIVHVTSDKVYLPQSGAAPFTEADRLGGAEPYAGSKACAELVSQTYYQSFLSHVGLATARAGNVLGGGDWAPERLLPDAIRAFQAGHVLKVRQPQAIRPWQHVLEASDAYLRLAEALWRAPAEFSQGWNIGPDEAWTVAELLDLLCRQWGQDASWQAEPRPDLPEQLNLRVDAALARQKLGWRPVLNLEQTLQWTLEGYRAWNDTDQRLQTMMRSQIERYQSLRDFGSADS